VARGSDPGDLQDRRTEITGPVDRKMVINCSQCRCECLHADFEDSTAPTWRNVIEGQVNLRDAVRREISFSSPEGKQYRLNEKTATLFVRRAVGTYRRNMFWCKANPFPGRCSILVCTSFTTQPPWWNAERAPYFYLPKMESHKEARLWNSVFNFAQDTLGIPRARFAPRCLLRRCRPHLKWMRFSLS